MPHLSMKAFSVRIRGIVQGVGFRYATFRQAERLGVRGFVRNLPDGSVEVVAEGPEEKLETFRVWLQHGPPGAVVHEADFHDVPFHGRFDRFAIEY